MIEGGLRRAILGVTAVVFVSKVLGFLREIVIAHQFGTSAEYDTYLIAIMLPALVYGVLNYAGFYLFVPYLTRKLEGVDTGNRREAFRSIQPTVNLAIVVALAVVAAIVILAPYVMRIWARDYAAAEFSAIVFYARLTAVIVLLGTTEAFLRAFLNACRVFAYPAAGAIVFNFVSIVCILLLSEEWSVGAIAAGLILGLVLQNVYLYLRWFGVRPATGFTFSLTNKDTRYIVSTGVILILIEFVNRSYFLIDRYFALPFGAGVVSALNYSQVLVQLPDAVIGFAIGTVVFPLFAAGGSGQDVGRFADTYRRAVIGALLVALPLAVIVLTNARDIVYLVFQRGHFDADSLRITSAVLQPYALTIAALFVVTLSIRASYSRGWGKLVFLFAVVVFGVKVTGTALFSSWFAYPGITAATTTSQVLFAALLLGTVVRKTEALRDSSLVKDILLLVLAAIVAWGVTSAVGVWLIDSWQTLSHIDAAARISVLGTVAILSFLGVALMFGLRQAARDSILGLRRGN